ncbi:MAG: alpha-2-macroglobulin family protein, partial [Candidatus Cloacimonas sp.]|nr:alpha-2-macroglobulin family protein [Candidatus Cloacimonas sp.]
IYEKGEFTLTFLAAGDDTVLSSYNPYFMFTISADVSDLSGETRSGTSYLSIGEKELILNPVLAEYIDVKDKQLSIPIQTTNLSGEPIAVKGNIAIALLQVPDHLQKNRLWNAPDRNYLEKDEFLKQFPNDIYGSEDKFSNWKVIKPVFAAAFDTPETATVKIDNLANLAPGVYVLIATASYKQQAITSKRYFTIYDSTSKKLPYPLADWFVPVKTTCEPGEKALVLIGSGYESASVLYEVEKDHKVIESKRVILSKEQRLFTLPITEADRGGFYLHFTYVIDGRLYIHDQFINVPWTNKKIDFEYMTFRDKLLPGQQEEWRLKLKDYTGGKISAEVLASMYDASLDAFRPNTWYASIYNSTGRSAGWSNYSFSNSLGLTMMSYLSGQPYPRRGYDSFNWAGYNVGSYGVRLPGRVMNSAAYSTTGSVRDIMMEKMSDEAYESSDIVSLQAGAGSVGDIAPEPEDLSGVQARSNFAETAFFYPELRTDENGELSFVFTVPEALTRWKFRALALTKDLLIGTSENTTVTQKPLMVLPNAPRFFREGDKITFSSKISSLDERDQSGNCQIFLFDAITMAPVDSIFGLNKAQQPFFVKKGESTVLNWELSIPFGISAVTYRVVARAGDFSDGEENTLPILSNRMLVTESLPLPVSGNSTKDFVFKKLLDSGSSTSIKNHKLTLEYTSNPAWYAVQALPYLMEYPYECSEQVFSRFYANSLASYIANSNPRIKRVFDSWRDTPNSAALLSNLEKNQELKAVLLQETPWVLDAQNESQSKQRIGLLFDLNNMANQYDSALTQLQKTQKPSGAWPWFPGMDDSWWVTQYIVEGFGHLDHLGVKAIREDTRVWQMLKTAIAYTDRKILQDYEDIKKYGHLKDDHLGYLEMHYLYARSFFKDVEIPASVSVAVSYFQDQADKYWLQKDLYGQGLIALALHRSANKLTPP